MTGKYMPLYKLIEVVLVTLFCSIVAVIIPLAWPCRDMYDDEKVCVHTHTHIHVQISQTVKNNKHARTHRHTHTHTCAHSYEPWKKIIYTHEW
jgi:hypothetical protein